MRSGHDASVILHSSLAPKYCQDNVLSCTCGNVTTTSDILTFFRAFVETFSPSPVPSLSLVPSVEQCTQPSLQGSG